MRRALVTTTPERSRLSSPHMTRIAASAFALTCVLAGTALAQPTTAPSPAPAPSPPVRPVADPGVVATSPLGAVGDTLVLGGGGKLPPKLEYLYDAPSETDATGKVVIHWFCSTRPKAVGASCADDLARLITVKEAGTRTYFVAYVNGSKSNAKKLDPIRESEGVGRGTVAFGRHVTRWMKKQKLTGPLSVVVDVDGKIAHIASGTTPEVFDARDKKVGELTRRIKEYTVASDGPAKSAPGAKFPLSVSVKLAPWLTYSAKQPAELKVTVASDIKCDATALKGDQIKIADKLLTATVNCSGPRGSYEARATLTFSYEGPSGTAMGLGQESASWKFVIAP